MTHHHQGDGTSRSDGPSLIETEAHHHIVEVLLFAEEVHSQIDEFPYLAGLVPYLAEEVHSQIEEFFYLIGLVHNLVAEAHRLG